MITEALEGYFVDFGESVVLGTTTATAIYDDGYGEALNAAGATPSLVCISTSVAGAAVAVGSAATVRGVNYTVRAVMPEPPDAALTRLTLERS